MFKGLREALENAAAHAADFVVYDLPNLPAEIGYRSAKRELDKAADHLVATGQFPDRDAADAHLQTLIGNHVMSIGDFGASLDLEATRAVSHSVLGYHHGT